MIDLTTLRFAAPIPMPAKLFGWLLVLAGCYFFYVFTVTPGEFFPGVAVETFSEKFGLYSTGVRVLGSVFGLLVALLLNSAALLALMLATRLFIEAGDVIVGLLLNGGPDANTWTLLAVAVVELAVLLYLLRHMRGRG
jgi:hypothetical protein